MSIRKVQETWNLLGALDPMWAILTEPKDTIGNRWQEEEFFLTGVREIDELMRDVAPFSGKLERERALDFGCGIGRLSRALASHFERVVGVDIARTMIDRANLLNVRADVCRFVLNESDRLEVFNDSSFSFIYSNIVLQHMPNQSAVKYLLEFARVLKPGGLLVFQMPGGPPRTLRFLAYYLFVSMQPFMPRALLDAVRQLRYRGADPAFIKRLPRVVMEMHGMPIAKIRKVFANNDMSLLDVRDVGDLGFGWRSYRYVFKKI